MIESNSDCDSGTLADEQSEADEEAGDVGKAEKTIKQVYTIHQKQRIALMPGKTL